MLIDLSILLTTLGTVWVTNVSSDSGHSWSSLDQWNDDQSKYHAEPNTVAIHNSGSIFVSGTIQQDSNLLDHWVIRRSDDKGLSWKTVDYWKDHTKSYEMAISEEDGK